MKRLLIFRKRLIGSLFLTSVLGIVFFSNINCNSSQKNQDSKKEWTNYASLNDSVQYVGMQVCSQCHLGIYKSFIETGMGKSFDLASKQKTSADFSRSTIYDKYSDFSYHSYWQNDSLMFAESRVENGDTIYKRTERIRYIVGSGQHTNSHMINVNGYVFQAPMTYYTQKKQWDLPPGFENGFNSRFSRAIGLECMTCHNSYPKFVIGSENKYDSIPDGIGCERCHGPGQAHVLKIQSGSITDTSKFIDYSIVNPAKLSIEKQFDVCQRCHIQGNAVLKKGKSFFDFKPGMHLSDVMNIFMPVFEGSNNEHIMASHAERLKRSRCYIASIEKVNSQKQTDLKPYKNALTCITCHNPHVSVRNTGTLVFNNACINCHNQAHEKTCTENPVELKKAENNCVSCHMVKSGAIDIPHVRVTDHFIRKPVSQPEVEKIRKFVTIACINNPQADDESRGIAYINYFEKFHMGKIMLDSAKSYFSDQSKTDITKNFEELIRIAFLQEDYKKVITYVNAIDQPLSFLTRTSFDNADALTCYRMAESFENTSDINNAVLYYKQAARLAPFYLEILSKYAVALTKTGQLAEAGTIYSRIINQNPKYEQAWSNLGFITLQLNNDVATAERCYDTALALNPDYEPAILNKAGLLAYQKKIGEAIVYLKQYLKHKPDSKKAKEILRQLGQYD